jgi:hypothetical protein
VIANSSDFDGLVSLQFWKISGCLTFEIELVNLEALPEVED